MKTFWNVTKKITLLLVVLSGTFFLACSPEETQVEEKTGEGIERPIAPDTPKDPKEDTPETPDVGPVERHQFVKFDFTHDLTGRKIPISYFEPDTLKDSSEKYPLVLALHGAEYFVSPDSMFLKAQERTAYMALAWMEKKNQEKYPAFVVAPNIHDGLWHDGDERYFGWSKKSSSDFVEKLLDSILTNNTRIDAKRIYLVGHSMGGIGTWYLGAKFKEKFAALVPLSSAFSTGDGIYSFVDSRIRSDDFNDLPVWGFIHRVDANSKRDEDGTRGLIKTMEEVGYAPVYTHRKDTIDHYLNREEIFAKIDDGKKYFYTEYSYPCQSVGDCHFAQEFALREDFLLHWLFKQRKQ